MDKDKKPIKSVRTETIYINTNTPINNDYTKSIKNKKKP